MIFSAIFFLAFVFSLMLGLYIISLDDKNPLNRLLFIIFAVLCVWLFCFSIANSARSYEMALFWRRFSVFGWGLIYAFVYHYVLLLTRENDTLLKKRDYLLIYLPALIVVFVFGLGPMASARYNLQNTTLGWINISLNDIWDWYFYIYYISYIAASLYLLYQWGYKLEKREAKKQSRIIITALIVAVIFGSLSDLVINTYTDLSVPQLAPIMVMIPLTAIFYCIKRYGLMSSEKSRSVKPGMILSEYDLSRYYKIVSLFYILSGLAHFVIQYFFQQFPLGITTMDILLSINSVYFI